MYKRIFTKEYLQKNMPYGIYCRSSYVNKSSYQYLEENEEVRENSYSKEILFVD